jgi:predicted CXXCH cytochrome family protein
VAVCESCHSDQAQAHVEKKVLHDPVFKQGCYICHDAHGGNREHLLRADVNDLCLQCHSPVARGLKNPENNTESILGNTVVLPAGYVAKSPHLEMDVKARTGHPVPSHPVSGTDPRGDGKSKPLTCVSCHDPHAGQEKNILLSKDGAIRSLCIECHKEQAQ